MNAEEHKKKAAECDQRVADSFERSDTDGFLSQWANGLTAQKHRMQAEILENDGMYRFVGLYNGDVRVKAKLISTKYGTCWLLRDDEADKYGRRFIPFGSNSRVQKRLGLKERDELDKAYADIRGKGYGMSGSCWVQAIRIGDEWGSDAKLA